MKTNVSDIELFFELLKVATGNRNRLSVTPSSKEWQSLFYLASKQTILGICFYGIQKLPSQQIVNLPMPLKMQWLATTASIQSRNELIDRRCVELQERLNKDGLHSCILKGQANAAIYPSFLSNLRQSGDIDIWVDEEFDELVSYVNSVAPTVEITRHHAHFAAFQDAEVELHFVPLILNNPFKQRRFNQYCRIYIERCCKNHIVLSDGKSKITAATRNFNIVFQLLHIYHHFFTEGIGLRQLLDYYFLMLNQNSHKDNFSLKDADGNAGHSIKMVDLLGLSNFASALMYVLHVVFGLPENKMLWSPHKENGLFLLNEIMVSGNFGHFDERMPKRMSKLRSYIYGNGKALRLGRFDRWAWFWTPLTRLYWYVWRKKRGYKE